MIEPLCVDLFCGRGGWARGFLDAGYRVVGFDLVDMSPWYPGEFHQADVASLDGSMWRGARVVIGSPPCQPFSRMNTKTRDPALGMVLVRAGKRFVDQAAPDFWGLENVGGAVRYISAELGPPSFRSLPWYIWGRFPAFLLPTSSHFFKGKKSAKPYTRYVPSVGRFKTSYRQIQGSDAAKTAIIPYPIARGLAEACLPEGDRQEGSQ